MNEAEVRREGNMMKVKVVVVHLRGGELPLVYDVGGAERADVEPLGEGDLVSGMLAQDIELAVEVGFVEGSLFVLRGGAWSVVFGQDDQWLKDERFAAESSGTKDGVVARDFAPPEDAEAKLFSDASEDPLMLFEILRVTWFEEQVPHGVLAGFGKLDTVQASKLHTHEFVGHSDHNTGKGAMSMDMLDDDVLWTHPAPSPSLASAPVAPRWVMLHKRFLASDTILCDALPLIWQT